MYIVKRYQLEDLIENFDQIIKSIKLKYLDFEYMKDNACMWLKYEKAWPEYLTFPMIDDINIIERYKKYKELSKIYTVSDAYNKPCLDYYHKYEMHYIDGVDTPIEEGYEDEVLGSLLFTRGFNSLIELVPIINTKGGFGGIVMNCNPDSINYRRLYINIDDPHGMSNIWLCTEKSLPELLDKFEEYRKKYIDSISRVDSISDDIWDLYYNLPHRKYVDDFGEYRADLTFISSE